MSGNKINWDSSALNRLRKSWADGVSVNIIAAQLGCGRSTVFAKAKQLDLVRNGPLKPKKETKVSRPPAPKQQSKTKPKKTQGKKVATTKTTLRGANALLALGPKQCRFPIGDPHDKDFKFCGETTTKQPYCPTHRAIAFQKPKEKKI